MALASERGEEVRFHKAEQIGLEIKEAKKTMRGQSTDQDITIRVIGTSHNLGHLGRAQN